MAQRNKARKIMQVGDRILIDKSVRKDVFILARVDIRHCTEKAFASKSGGDFTIGVKVWKSDYVWNDKSQMWTHKR